MYHPLRYAAITALFLLQSPFGSAVSAKRSWLGIPKSARPAGTLTSIDLDGRPMDEQFLATVLQGLVNRTVPRLYVRDALYEGGQDPGLRSRTHDWWREDLERRGTRFRDEQNLDSLVHQHRTAFRGAILYEPACWTDPNQANSLNVIAALCGIDDLLPVTPALNQRLHLPVVRDLRGKWTGPTEPYRWALADPGIRARCSRSVALHIHPWSLFALDYGIENRALPFWIGKVSFATPSGAALYDRLARFVHPNSPILGAWQSWWPRAIKDSVVEGTDELAVMKFFSDRGRYLVPVVSRGNFSVHSGYPLPVLRQKVSKAPALDRSKVYVTFLQSDGDNLSAFMLIRPLLWHDAARGSVPIGWNFGPAMEALCPNVLDTFYRTATPDDLFVTAGSGLGYVMAGYGEGDRQHPRTLPAYFDLTDRAMRAADSDTMWAWWMNRESIQRYVDGVGSLNTLFLEPEHRTDAYENSFTTLPRRTGADVDAFHNFASAGAAPWPDSEAERWKQSIVQRIGSRRPAFVTLGFNGLATTPTHIAALMRRLGPGFTAVRPDHFARLYRKARTGLPSN